MLRINLLDRIILTHCMLGKNFSRYFEIILPLFLTQEIRETIPAEKNSFHLYVNPLSEGSKFFSIKVSIFVKGE